MTDDESNASHEGIAEGRMAAIDTAVALLISRRRGGLVSPPYLNGLSPQRRFTKLRTAVLKEHLGDSVLASARSLWIFAERSARDLRKNTERSEVPRMIESPVCALSRDHLGATLQARAKCKPT